MKKGREELPIYEVRGNLCEGVLQNGISVENVSFRKIKNFLSRERK